MPDYHTKIQDGGRLVIPAACRRVLHMEPGGEVVLRVKEDELIIFPARHALVRARRLVKKYIKKDRKLADELIAERRREAANE